MKLGKNPAKFDSTVPHLLSLSLDTSIVPQTLEEYKKIQYWPVLLNDQIGDCTIAGIGHIIQYWNTVGKLSFPVMTDLEANTFYQIIGGYIPGNTATDNGCVELDVLNYFNTNGIMAASQLIKIDKFLSLTPSNIEQIKASVFHLGNCYIGLNLPQSALQTTSWDVVPNSPVAGGHAVCVVGYDDTKQVLYIVSWGCVIPMSYQFLTTYCDESWSLYSTDWINKT